MPVQFRATEATEAAAWPSEDWWRGFKSSELNGLIEQARTQNFDIVAAIARIAAGRRPGAHRRRRHAADSKRLGECELAAFRHIEPAFPRPRAAARWAPRPPAPAAVRLARARSTPQLAILGLNVAYEVDFWGHNLAAHAGRQGQRRVQPLRSAGGRADRGDQRGQYLVHRARVGRPPGRRAAQPGGCRADAGGDPRPARCRDRERARRRAAGIARGRRAGHHPQPAQPARAGTDRPRHPGRPPA